MSETPKSLNKLAINVLSLFVITTILLSSVVFSPSKVAGQSTNQISVLFATIQSYLASGTNFTDKEVTGTESWSSNFANTIDSTNDEVNNLSLSLESNIIYDNVNPDPASSGPPTYKWSFGNISQNPLPDWSPQAVVSLTDSTNQASFKPGFNFSWSVDKNQFKSPDIQMITLKLTPKETRNYNIVLDTGKSTIVQGKINPPVPDETGNIDLATDGHRLTIYKHQLQAGEVVNYTIPIEVNLTSTAVEFVPDITVSSSQDLWEDSVSGSTFSKAIGDVGTWTWTAEGDYNCTLHEINSRVVSFRGYSKKILEENTARVVFGSHLDYHSPSARVINGDVEGQISGWFSSFTKLSSGIDAKNVNLNLYSDKFLTRFDINPIKYGPPNYSWSFGNIPEYTGADWIPQTGTGAGMIDAPVKFAPGYDTSYEVDKITFTRPSVQVLTIRVTPREHPFFDLQIDTGRFSEASTKIISPGTDQANGIINNSGFLWIHKEGLTIGKTYIYKAKIQVIPNYPAVQYRPTIIVSSAINKDQGTIIGTTLSHPISDLGIWTWTTEEAFKMDWYELLSRRIFFDSSVKIVPPPSKETTADFLLTPDQKTIAQTGSSSIFALIITAIFLLMSEFFNSSIKSNYSVIRGWLKSVLNKMKLGNFLLLIRGNNTNFEKSHLKDYTEFLFLLMVNACINTFIKRPSSISAFWGTFIPSIIMAIIVTLSYAGAQTLMSNYRYKVPATIRMYYVAILITIMFVVFSWVLKYPPILIYGFVGGYVARSLSRKMNPNQKAKSILISVAIVLVISVISFYIRGVVHKESATFWENVLDNTLAELCCGGLLGLVLFLLPFDFLDGADLKKWNFWIWLLIFYEAAFAFAYFIIIQDDNLLTALRSEQSIGVYIFMGICILIGMGSWLFFLLRSRRVKGMAT